MKNLGWILLLAGAALMLYSLEYYFDFFHYSDDVWMQKKGFTFRDMFFRKDIDFWLAKKDKVQDSVWSGALYIHIIGSLLPILTGPFQFFYGFRKKYLSLHRTLGKIYVFSILFLGVPTGYYMAFYANGGIFAVIAFLILSTLWLTTTWLAYQKVRQKKIKAHEDWMKRSYAVTFAAVTLRLWTDILPNDFGVAHDETLVLAAWLAWIPNLIIAEILIRLPQIKAFFR
ncbi:MAG: DUF2306 domain-containing protein [Bacteroidia bacterium]|nr:DUF2306 domain-containing protein [Bacteroidia bacterium]